MEENNKLIAEFMDLSIKEGVCYYTDADDMFPMGIEVEEPYIPYDDDWDWLYAVVDKIEMLGDNSDKYTITMYYDEVVIFDNDEFYAVVNVKGFDRKETLYKAVVEFIKFYNQNK